MILYRWQGKARNFGDELNTVLWPRLLPGFFDDDASVRFLGIGSVLDSRHDPHGLKLVAGSGYGGYEPPAALDSSWRIYWVRGPRSARLLGLDPALGLGDPAALLPLVGAPLRDTPLGGESAKIGYMPHFESAMHGAWARVAAAAGIELIDPRNDPIAVVEAIRGCRLLLSEALHGAIVADALRVPWVAIRPLASIHRAKWQDWADTLDLKIAFQVLPPSTLAELARASPLARWHAGRALLEGHAGKLKSIAAERLMARAVAALQNAARAAPQLSDERDLQRGQTRMMERLATLRREAGVKPSEPPERLPPKLVASDPMRD
jgi:succinoglycan biosynthesis protein ExoV